MYTSVKILRLDGVPIRGRLWTRSSELVIFVPGFLDDQYSQGRFDRWAWHLCHENLSVLTFDFEGCGDSEANLMTLKGTVDDLTTVCHWAQEQNFTTLNMVTYGLGAAMGLYELRRTDVYKKAAFVGGVTSPGSETGKKMWPPEYIRQFAETGSLWIHNPPQMNRSVMHVDPSFLRLFADIPQQSLLSEVNAPVMMIHGDGDKKERALCEASQKILGYLPQKSYIHVIPGAHHGFWGHIDEVGHKLATWFSASDSPFKKDPVLDSKVFV